MASSDWEVTPTCGAQLVQAERVLSAAGSLAPWQDALELLSYTLDLPLPILVAQPALQLRPLDVRRYALLVGRRAAGEELPRITGHITFMGLDLAVGVSSPPIPADARRRAEIALEWARHQTPGELSAVEIGTGCGAIALALAALEPRFTRIYAVDSSQATLETATANGARYLLNLVITWLEGAGVDVVPEPVDLIICATPSKASTVSEAGATSADGIDGRAERGMHDAPPQSMRLPQQALAKLRPGGVLIVGFDRARESETLAAIGLALPDAQVWVDAQADGDAIAVAQLLAK